MLVVVRMGERVLLQTDAHAGMVGLETDVLVVNIMTCSVFDYSGILISLTTQ